MAIYLYIAFSMGLAVASIISHLTRREAGVNAKGLIHTTVVGLLIVAAIGYATWYLSQGTARAYPQVVIREDTKIPLTRKQPREAGHDTFRVTAYCQKSCCCGKYADGITASGHKIQPGDRFVAAPKNIPFHTLITIPGYNNGQPVPVLDRGGAITAGRLDLYFDTHQEALNWGVQNVDVSIERS